MSSYVRIPEADYQKAKGQLRLQLNDTLKCFKIYGLDVLIPGAVEEIMELAELFGQRVRGKDTPIKLRVKRNHRGG